MFPLSIKIKKLLFIIIFLQSLTTLYGQDIEPSKYYKEQFEKRNLTLQEREVLIDSLLSVKGIQFETRALADIYYKFIGEYYGKDFDKAIEYCLKIKDIGKSLSDEDFYIKNQRNLANIYYKNKEYLKAVKAGEFFFEKYPALTKRKATLYRIVANAFNDLGDYEQAIFNYQQSIYVFKKLEDLPQQGRTSANMLETFMSLDANQYEDQILECIKLIDSIDKESSFDISDKIIIKLNEGVFYDRLKNSAKAIKAYNTSLKLSKENEDNANTTRNLINLGSLYKNNGELKMAKKYLLEAKETIKDFPYIKSMISNNLADVYQKENNHQKALIYYQKAIVQALQSDDINYQKLPATQDLEFSSKKIDVLGYLIDKANGWIAYYDAEGKPEYLENALETFTLADKLIDIIYVESREDLSKLFWRKKGATFYPKAVEVCFRLKQPEKAFFFMEKNKAMLLLENMTNATAKRLSKLPENILAREQHLIKEIKTLESEIQENTEIKTVDSLKNNVFKYKKEYTAFIDSLEIEFPKYYNYKKNINIVTFENVQQQLEKDELIIQYIVGKEKGFVALISSGTIQLQELPMTEKLKETVTVYKEAVSKPFISKEDKNTYVKVAKKLYQQLIPFDNSETELQQKRITIIADGILQYIPFEALLTSKEEYLIKNTKIHYNYSLSAAAQSQQNNASISQKFIAIAPTKFKNDQFGALATSEEELKKLANIFDANHFQYENATKERFTKAYGNYKIVHLSTHGGIDNTIPWIAFYDEKMTLDELYFTKNQSELVVLSACKTSDGELKKGEGVMSLARGFFNAGAKSVVSSLWDINEKASNDVIQEFYKNIANGDTKSAALQKAKLTYIQQNENTSEASPYYWSGLTITGDVTPIEDLQSNNYVYYSFGSLFLVILGFSLRKLQKKKAA
jgi:CHAT domain-containing protein